MGVPFWWSKKTDCRILGSILDTPFYGNYHLHKKQILTDGVFVADESGKGQLL